MTGAAGALAAEWIGPARTALLIIDMQVDFAAPHGAMGRAGADLTTVPAALAAARRLATSARAAGVAVIFVRLETTPGTNSPAWAERRHRLGEAAGEGGFCRVGETGADFVGPRPTPGETVIGKRRYSGFFATDLESRLAAGGIDTLVVCGLTTECCVAATARDAFERDYHVFLAADACAAYEPSLHAAALKSLALNCAILVTAEDVEAAWAI